MGTDFFPRLCKVVSDKKQIFRLVNEQMEIGLLFATIGVDICLVIAPVILISFYSSDFLEATTMLRWQCVGVGLRVLGYPLGYLLMAQRRNWAYFALQLSFWVSYYLAITIGVSLFGMRFIGIDYIIAYAVYLFFGYSLSYRKGLRPSSLLIKIFLFSVISEGIILLLLFFLPNPYSYILSSVCCVLILGIAIYVLKKSFEIDIFTNILSLYTKFKEKVNKNRLRNH